MTTIPFKTSTLISNVCMQFPNNETPFNGAMTSPVGMSPYGEILSRSYIFKSYEEVYNTFKDKICYLYTCSEDTDGNIRVRVGLLNHKFDIEEHIKHDYMQMRKVLSEDSVREFYTNLHKHVI